MTSCRTERNDLGTNLLNAEMRTSCRNWCAIQSTALLGSSSNSIGRAATGAWKVAKREVGCRVETVAVLLRCGVGPATGQSWTTVPLTHHDFRAAKTADATSLKHARDFELSRGSSCEELRLAMADLTRRSVSRVSVTPSRLPRVFLATSRDKLAATSVCRSTRFIESKSSV